MKQKLNKFLSFFKKFPVIITSVIMIPILISSLRWVTSIDHLYHNYYYDGTRIPADHENFQLTGIKKIGSVVQVASAFSYQGGACYENYYAVCCDNFEAIIIYDSETMKLAHAITTGQYNTQWHCNQMYFGTDFYSATDKFPLLYISMEHKDQRCIVAFRIYSQSGEYYVKRIQTITLEFSYEEDIIYYPNAYLNYDKRTILWAGYTEDSYMKSDSNKLKYYEFMIPDYRMDTEVIETKDALNSFELPSETATQGGFISDGYLYQTFSFNSKTDPLKTPKMRVVNLEKRTIVKDYQNLGAEFGVYEEFEHVAISRNGRLLSLGNPFNLYEFEYVRKDSD